MRIMPTLFRCRDKAKRCFEIAEHHAHLGYLTVGVMELHGLASLTCGGCLIFGLLVEITRWRSA